MAPKGIKVYNPAFDVTDHSLITAIVTEYGIARTVRRLVAGNPPEMWKIKKMRSIES